MPLPTNVREEDIVDLEDPAADVPPLDDAEEEKRIQGEIDRLAGMPLWKMERHIHEAANSCDLPVSAMRKLVKAAQRGEDAGKEMVFPEIDPWPDEVDGSNLLIDIVRMLDRYLFLPPGAATAIALWILHAHAHDTAYISAILALTSPTPACGKTTTMEIIGALVPKPLSASNITSAALFRAVEKWSPTLLVDEADTFIRDSDELRGIINCGHNRSSAYVIRTVGDGYEPMQFKTWAPKVIALIGKLPPTLASRAIHIELTRLKEGEARQEVRADKMAHLKPLRRMAARWVENNADDLRKGEPDIPAALSGRTADNWRHLLAIADVAGGDWPERARKAAEVLSSEDDSRTASELLLSDIRDLFEIKGVDRMFSKDIALELERMEGRPWPEWKGGKPISANQIARILSGFKVKSQTIWIGEDSAKGYTLDQFDDVFSRFSDIKTSIRQNPQKTAENHASQNVSKQGDLTFSNPLKPAENCGVGRVDVLETPKPGIESNGAWNAEFDA